MIKALPVSFLHVVASKFDERFWGLVVDRVQSWRTIVMFFIQKEAIRGPGSLKDYRGISLFAVFLK
eukprot:11217381-Lingulodinium_polyedra.AAC.1